MATVSLLGSTINTTAGIKTVTATPAVGDLIVILVYHSDSDITTWSPPTDNNSLGVYDDIIITNSSSGAQLGAYVRTTKIAAATSTIFTAPAPPSPTLDTGGGLAVFKITGMQRVGLSAIRQFSSFGTQGAGTAYPSIGFSFNKLSGNPVIGGIIIANMGTNTVGPDTGYTEAFETTYATPAITCEAQFNSAGDTTSSLAWSGTITTSFIAGVMIGIELDASPASDFFLWRNL